MMKSCGVVLRLKRRRVGDEVWTGKPSWKQNDGGYVRRQPSSSQNNLEEEFTSSSSSTSTATATPTTIPRK